MSQILPNVLFVTQTLGYKKACGIGIIGDLIGKALQHSNKYNFITAYCDSLDEVEKYIDLYSPIAVIYNYALGSTPWMNEIWLRDKYNQIPHLKIHHDMYQELVDTFSPQSHWGYKYIIADDPTLTGNDNVFITQRLMPEYDSSEVFEPDIPTIGFQGFGPYHKGIVRLAEIVNSEFDEAILRLHIPFGYYGDPHGHQATARVEECRRVITKPGIQIVATHEFLETKDVLDMLAHNTINCYLYDFNDKGGLASSPDYALAVKKPIAVTRSHQLRNFWFLEPSVCIENNSLKEIIANGIKPLEMLHKNYVQKNVISDYERIIDTVTNK